MVELTLAGLAVGAFILRELRRGRRALERIALEAHDANSAPAWRELALDAVEFCDQPAPQSVERRDRLRELKARLAVYEARR